MPSTLTIVDRIDPDRAVALAELLDRDPAALRVGAVLPLAWQWCYFLERPAQRSLGVDGHPVAGFPTPPAPGLRRMFAGGRITALPRPGVEQRVGQRAGLQLGDDAVLRREVVAQRSTQGRNGTLHFATVRDEITVSQTAVLHEARDIVYLAEGSGRAPARAAQLSPAAAPDITRDVQVEPTLLFRYSALTYNAHRIHYDRDFAREHEGYPGLVVHGPLQAVLMADTATALVDPARHQVTGMTYRLVAPLFEDDGLHVLAGHDYMSAPATQLWARVVDDTGRVTARAPFTLTDTEQ